MSSLGKNIAILSSSYTKGPVSNLFPVLRSSVSCVSLFTWLFVYREDHEFWLLFFFSFHRKYWVTLIWSIMTDAVNGNNVDTYLPEDDENEDDVRPKPVISERKTYKYPDPPNVFRDVDVSSHFQVWMRFMPCFNWRERKRWRNWWNWSTISWTPRSSSS